MKEKVSVRIPTYLSSWAAEKAKREDRTISSVFIDALTAYRNNAEIREVKLYAYASAILSARELAKSLNKKESEVVNDIIVYLRKENAGI